MDADEVVHNSKCVDQFCLGFKRVFWCCSKNLEMTLKDTKKPFNTVASFGMPEIKYLFVVPRPARLSL